MPKKKALVPYKQEIHEVASPSAPDAEVSVLGAIIMNEVAYQEALAFGLRSEHFAVESHRKIYYAIRELVESRRKVDQVAIANELERQKSLEVIGGVVYLSSLLDGALDFPDSKIHEHVKFHIEILKEKYMRRQLINYANRTIASANDPSDPAKWIASGLQSDLLMMQGDFVETQISPIRDFSGDLMSRIEKLMHMSPDDTVGIPFGISELDETTTGMREGQLIVIGGFPKAGKSAFAIDTCRKIAKKKIPILFFSREMRREELLERIWSQESGISYFKIRKPAHLSISEFRLLQETKAKVDEWPLYIDDTVRDIGELVPRAHLMIRKHAIKLTVLDYLQILNAPGDKPYERVTFAVNALTQLSKDTGIPMMCLSQLTSSGSDKKDLNIIPNMEMLRESQQIKMNAHLILFVYHPVDENMNPTGNDLLVIGAQRAGPTGHIKAYFDVTRQTWDERSPIEQGKKQESFFPKGA